MQARHRVYWSLFALLILLTAGAFWRVGRISQTPLPPLTISFWFWHQPFRLTDRETAALHRMGVTALFVRAGTFRATENAALPAEVVLPQVWKSRTKEIGVHLVFPVDASLIRRFEKTPEETLADAMAAGIRRERERAAQASVRVVGVQLDFDCPTRLLPRYASLLRRLRPKLAPQDAFSVTLLTSAYSSPHIGEVLDAVDFSVPQFYEAATPATRARFTPISDLKRFERGLHSAERLGRLFYAGIPAYGHALVYDGANNLRGMFRDAGAPELLTRPDEFHLLQDVPLNAKGAPAATPDEAIGEDLIEFGPTRSATDFRLLFDLPTPALLAKHLCILNAHRPRNCQGVLLYRFPEAGEISALPLVSTEAVWRGVTPAPRLSVRFRTRRQAPYALIESETPTAPRTELFVSVTNDGDSGTRIAPGAVEVTLRFDRPGLESLAPGTFDSAEAFSGDPLTRSSLLRADGIRCYCVALDPGERRVIGPIVLPADGPQSVRGTWSAMCPGGFGKATGDIPSFTFSSSVLTSSEEKKP